jgi:hypothetical protein
VDFERGQPVGDGGSGPAVPFASDVGEDDADEGVDEEGENTGSGDFDGGVGGFTDGFEKAVFEAADDARPAPIGGNEGAGERLNGSGEGEHGAGERELKADEIDAEEAGLFGRAHETGDAETDESHGEVHKDEEERVREGISRDVAKALHEDEHPHGLDAGENGEEPGFGSEVGEGAKSGEFFFLEEEAFAGDFARGIVGAHEGQEDDLEHDESGNETAGFELGLEKVGPFFEFGDGIVVHGFGEALDGVDAFRGENDDENGETEDDGELEKKLDAIPDEDFPPAREESEKLGGDAGEFYLLRLFVEW